MKELIGKTINSVLIDKNEQTVLQFNTSDGPIVYVAFGDCCSYTWFADITGFTSLVGQTVLSVDEVELPQPEDGKDERNRDEYDQVYGYNLKTTGGHAHIVYRNSSNGYYGGWLGLRDEIPDSTEMVQITDDYSA
jgi:hypothetical protein